MSGEPPAEQYSAAEQRTRGRLLARLHSDLAQLGSFGQREAWRRCEQILADPTLDQVLAANQQQRPNTVRILRWHLERAP